MMYCNLNCRAVVRVATDHSEMNVLLSLLYSYNEPLFVVDNTCKSRVFMVLQLVLAMLTALAFYFVFCFDCGLTSR